VPITGIHHIVIRVHDLDAAIASYRKLGLTLERTLETPAIGKQAIFSFPDGTFLELVAPLSADSAVAKALAARGEGVHTVALATDDIGGTVRTFEDGGASVIQDPSLDGIAFVHPKSAHGVLLQVSEVTP